MLVGATQPSITYGSLVNTPIFQLPNDWIESTAEDLIKKTMELWRTIYYFEIKFPYIYLKISQKFSISLSNKNHLFILS